ncbi:MAG: PilZ domain-containing protein [Mariprofundus sp.]
MEAVNDDLIDKLIVLAADLPEEQRRQLLELVSGWRSSGRYALRESYPEVLSFISGDCVHYGRAEDVSATGIFIETSAELDTGAQVRLALTFISAPNPVQLSGTVVRKTDTGIAVQFDAGSQTRDLDAIISKQSQILRHK